MGDSSDNIPGVKGIGEKTAKNLLHEFGSLDGVYENLESKVIKPKQRENLVTYKDNAYLSYDLATIRPTAPIEFDPLDAVIQPYNSQELYNLFVRLEFVKLIDKYHLRGANVEAAPVKMTSEPLQRCDYLPEPGTDCALYLAPDGSIGVAWEQGVCAVTPLEAMCLDGLLSQGEFILHDCKSTWHALDNLNLPAPRVVFDTALAAYDLNPSASDYPVSKLATNFLGMNVEDGDPIGCAEAVWKLREVMTAELNDMGMTVLYFDMELPLCDVLYRMEKEGIAVDRPTLDAFGKMLAERIDDCEKLIYSYSEGPFNINSTKQLGVLLFETLGLPPVKKTKTGYSTNVEVLEKLKDKHPIIPAIMDYRMLTKLKSTYADGLMKVIDPDGRVRTTFQNLVTATGRLSSTDPNLQNIPVRTDLGAEIRKMFVPKAGCVLVDADYS